MTVSVSIITSTYNRAQIVRRAIESVLVQTRADWEMNLVAGCTPDNTADVVASYNDPRVRFYNLPGSRRRVRGAIAKNHAIQKMASGKNIAYFDDDSIFRAEFLKTMLGYLDVHPGCRFAYC